MGINTLLDVKHYILRRYHMLLKPGKYRFAELAELCGTSRTTAEKFPDRYQLEETQVLYNGREVSGVVLDHEKIDRISQDYPRVAKGVTEHELKPYATQPLPLLNTNDALVEELRNRIKSLENDISQIDVDKTRIFNVNTQLQIENAGLISDKKILENKVIGLEDQIETLRTALSEAQKRAESEAERAKGFNNQLANAHAKLQKIPDPKQMDDYMSNMQHALDKHMQAVEERLKLQQKETVIKVEQPEQESIGTPKKGFKIPFTKFRLQAE